MLSCDVKGFNVFLALLRIKKLKHVLFWTKFRTYDYLVYIIVLKWLELKLIVICLKLRTKLRFQGFLNIFGTFAHEVAQTLFVLHEILHTTLFGKYFCVEMVRVEKHSHMLKITCKVSFLRVLKHFLHLCAWSKLNLVCFARNFVHNIIWYILSCWKC